MLASSTGESSDSEQRMDDQWLDGLPDLHLPESPHQKRGRPSRKHSPPESCPKDLPETRKELNRWASDSAKSSFLCSAARRLSERVVQYDKDRLGLTLNSIIQEYVNKLLELQRESDYRGSHPCPFLFLGGYPERVDFDVRCTLLAVYHDALVSGGKEIVPARIRKLHPSLWDNLRHYISKLSVAPQGPAILDGFLAEIGAVVANNEEPTNVRRTKTRKEHWWVALYERTVKAVVEAILSHFDHR